jgi:hypothetical protein
MGNLDWLDWESIVSPLTFEIVQHGALPPNVTELELSRDSNLKLSVIGKGFGSFDLGQYINLQPGEFVPSLTETIGERSGNIVTLKGLIIDSASGNLGGFRAADEDPLFIQALVHEAELTQSDLEVKTHVEWTINFSINDLSFPRSTVSEQVTTLKRERTGGEVLERTIKKSSNALKDHFECELNIDSESFSIVVGCVSHCNENLHFKPGFVEYASACNSTVPSEESRERILAALSFALGRRLISVGSTSLAENGDRVKCTVREPRLLGKTNFDYASKPAVPIYLQQATYLLDELQISRVTNAILAKMKTLNIAHSLNLIWLAQVSPLDVRAAHIGAAIESLRDSYCTSEQLSTSLLPKSIWKNNFQKSLLKTFDDISSCLDHSKIDPKNLKIMRNKLDGLNQKSSNMKYKDFFDSLSLTIGDVGEKALRERNNPAHGFHYKESQYQDLMLTTNALYTLFNRLLLSITKASDCYIDYSTYGFPVREP